MSIKAAAKVAPHWYAPEQDGPEDEKTAFQLRPLTALQMLEVGEALNAGEQTRAYRVVLKHGLLGWRNFADEAGPVLFGRDMETNLARLTVELVTELGARLLEASQVSAEEKKT